jgi:hypothetical protein
MDEIGEDHFQNGVLNYTAQDGLARGWNMAGRSGKHIGKRTTHPIQDLMAENRKKWDNQLASQSRSLEDAVREYHTRYGRLPPKGFDDWYNFCVENNVKIIDDVSRSVGVYEKGGIRWLELMGSDVATPSHSTTKSTTISNRSWHSRLRC